MNRTGGQRTANDVVVTHPSADNSFTGTAVEGYAGKILVVAETIESLATGTLWERGGPFDIEVEGAVTWNDGLRTSGTPYLAEAAPSPTGTGVFAIALEQAAAPTGTVSALFLDEVAAPGGDGGVTTIEIQEDDVKITDASIVNFEGGGGKVTDEGGGKATINITPGAGSEVGGCHGISYPISNQTINEGNTYTSGDLRDGTYVPLDAVGIWLMITGTPSVANKVLCIDSADDVPDAYSSRMRSSVAAPYDDMVMVRLGTGANAGKINIKALSGNWTAIYGWPVGYWK